MKRKVYLNQNVYDAAQERIKFIFDEFERVCVSFSGGKDSTVVLNLAIDEARKRGRKVDATFIDLEAFYQLTIDHVQRMFEDNRDVVRPTWICLPMESNNSLSAHEPTWIWWESGRENIWVRPMPQNEWVVNIDNQRFPFYDPNKIITFERFVVDYNDYLAADQKTAVLLGLRTDESLNRFRAIVADKTKYKGRHYSTKAGRAWSFSPIYDWHVSDIWTYTAKYNKPYNKLYDLFYRAGVPISEMRVDEPFGNEAKAGLNMFRVIEPKTWARVVNRVSGANFGNIYANTKALNGQVTLPPGHTWKSFCKFLLSTLPADTAANYRNRFIKFIRYWNKKGCPMRDDFIGELENRHPDAVVNTHEFSKRGTGDKEVVRFTKILDEHPIDRKTDLLTWRRMCMCILKNDYSCRGLSFSINKAFTKRGEYLINKYKSL